MLIAALNFTVYIIIALIALVVIGGILAAIIQRKTRGSKNLKKESLIKIGELPNPKTKALNAKYKVKNKKTIIKNKSYKVKAKIVYKTEDENTLVPHLELKYLIKKIKMPEMVSSFNLNVKLKSKAIGGNSKAIPVKVASEYGYFVQKQDPNHENRSNFNLSILVYNLEQGCRNKKKSFKVLIPLDLLTFVQKGYIHLIIDSSISVSEIGASPEMRTDLFKFYNMDNGTYDSLYYAPQIEGAFSNLLIYNNLLNNQANSLYQGRIVTYIQDLFNSLSQVYEYSDSVSEISSSHKKIMKKYKKGKTKKFQKEINKNINLIKTKASFQEKVALIEKLISIFSIENNDHNNPNNHFLNRFMDGVGVNYYNYKTRNYKYINKKILEIDINNSK